MTAPTIGAVEGFRIAAFGLVGLAIGSFLTVVAERVPLKRSIVRPRSSCPKCGAMIRSRDNVPVVSWLLLRGRCRTCRSRISPLYPATELATAGLFAGAAARYDRVLIAAMIALFLAMLLAVSVIDARHRIIPNRITYPAYPVFGAFVLAGALGGAGLSGGQALVGMAAYGLVLGLIALFLPRAMGLGDAKLTGLIGLVLGSLGLRYVAVAAGLGILAGGLGGIVILIVTRDPKKQVPFGPYLAFGAALAAFAAPQIAHAYLRLLGRS